MNRLSSLTHIFYRNGDLHNIVTKDLAQSIFRGMGVPLAILNLGNTTESALLSVRLDNSIHTTSTPHSQQTLGYTVYGFSAHAASVLIAFTGEIYQTLAAGYLLGSGYRFYQPTLMRLTSPDSLAPFDILNSYAYCAGDPVNYTDPSGHQQRSVFNLSAAWMNQLPPPKKSAYTLIAKDNESILLDYSDVQSSKMTAEAEALNTYHKLENLKASKPTSRRQEINSRLSGIDGQIETGESYNTASALRSVTQLKRERKALSRELKTLPLVDRDLQSWQCNFDNLNSQFTNQMKALGLPITRQGIAQLAAPDPMDIRIAS